MTYVVLAPEHPLVDIVTTERNGMTSTSSRPRSPRVRHRTPVHRTGLEKRGVFRRLRLNPSRGSRPIYIAATSS